VRSPGNTGTRAAEDPGPGPLAGTLVVRARLGWRETDLVSDRGADVASRDTNMRVTARESPRVTGTVTDSDGAKLTAGANGVLTPRAGVLTCD
jgi:hypothetical protein